MVDAVSQVVYTVTVEPPRQKGKLHCSQLLTLKDVFDAGFRPFGVTESDCSVGKSDIELLLPPTNQAVILDVEIVSFEISIYDTVKCIDIRTIAAPVEQTGIVLRQLASALGMKPRGLEEALKRATPENPKWFDVWTQDWSNDWCSVRLGFQPLTYFLADASKGYREMKSHVVMSITWKPTEVGPTYRRKPVTPPEGYEYVSMDMPGSDLVRLAQTTDSPALAHLRYPTESQRQAIISAPVQAVPNLIETLQDPKATPQSAEGNQPATSRWLLWIAFAAAVIGLLCLTLKKSE